MTTDTKELRRLAVAATAGGWRAGDGFFSHQVFAVQKKEGFDYVLLEGNQNYLSDAIANIAYVGAANPAAILSLLDANDTLAQQVATLREALEKYGRHKIECNTNIKAGMFSCNCGLSVVLASAPAASDGEG